MTETQELVAELRRGLSFVMQRLPMAETSLRHQVAHVQAEAENFPVQMESLFVELASLAYSVLARKELVDLHEYAAHFLDLRLQLVFSQLRHDIELHLRELFEHLGVIAIELPSQQGRITKMRQAIAALQGQLHKGVFNKHDEDNVMALILYLSQEMKLLFAAIPPQSERLWKPLANRWNNILFSSVRYVKYTGRKPVSETAKLPGGERVNFLVASQ